METLEDKRRAKAQEYYNAKKKSAVSGQQRLDGCGVSVVNRDGIG